MGQDPSLIFLNQYPRANTILYPQHRNPIYDQWLDALRTFPPADLPDKEEWTTRMFYFKFLERDEHQPYAYESFWAEHRVDPNRMWKHIHNSHALGIYQDVHFKFLH